MKKTVGVLGCGGAVGKEVIRHLSEKYSILGGQRSFCEFENKNVKWIKTDIFDPESLDRFCRQCDLVINSATLSFILEEGPAGRKTQSAWISG